LGVESLAALKILKSQVKIKCPDKMDESQERRFGKADCAPSLVEMSALTPDIW